MPERDCLITVGVPSAAYEGHPPILRQNYEAGIRRMKSGLDALGFRGDLLAWTTSYPEGSPPHDAVPFAFKPFAFQAAKSRGYERALWLDASIRIKRPVAELFLRIERLGYLFFAGSASVGEYCNDEALASLGITREKSFELPSCSASVVGLDLSSTIGAEFLRQWVACAMDGVTFHGPKWSGIHGWPAVASADPRVKGHRHDQTAASVIAARLGMVSWLERSAYAEFFENDREFVRSLREADV